MYFIVYNVSKNNFTNEKQNSDLKMKRNTILVDDGEKYLFFIVLASIEKLIGHIVDVPLCNT